MAFRPTKIMVTEPLILCENLVKIYRLTQEGGASVEVQALQGLDITVAEGEMLGIVGASGSGNPEIANALAPALTSALRPVTTSVTAPPR